MLENRVQALQDDLFAAQDELQAAQDGYDKVGNSVMIFLIKNLRICYQFADMCSTKVLIQGV